MMKTLATYFAFLVMMPCLVSCAATPEARRDVSLAELEASFADPPIEARPRGMWVWPNGIGDLSRITWELEELKAKGWGGVEIWDVGLHVDNNSVVPPGPPIMQGESLAAMTHAIREATRLGLEIGLNTTNSYIGDRGGAYGLHRSHTELRGPRSFEGELPFPQIERRHKRHDVLVERDEQGRPVTFQSVAVVAIPLDESGEPVKGADTVDLTDRMDASGVLRWEVPAGRWRVTRYISAPTGEAGLFIRDNAIGRTHEFFSAEATEANLDFFLDPLTAELGPLQNTALKYFFMESYELKDALWTPGLEDVFRQRVGYDITPYLPALDGVIVRSPEVTERFLFDYRRLLSDLAVENHFEKANEILKRHGMGYTAEAGGPGPPVHDVPFADLAALGALTTPRGEFWVRDDPQRAARLQIIKGPASAAHLYNRRFVEAESFTSVQLWQHGPDKLKPYADRAFAEGLNRIVYHVSAHTPWESGEPGWVYPFGTLMYPGRAWWPKSRPWHDYLARVGYLMQQGHFVGDALYYYGHAAPQHVKPKHVREGLGPGYDYDVTNSEIILERLAVRNGRLVLPHGQSYEILVLPDADAMSPQVLAKVEQLVKDGATVVGRPPNRSHGLKDYAQRDAEVRRIAQRLWGPVDGQRVTQRDYGKGRIVWGRTPRQVLAERGLGPDFAYASDNDRPHLDYIHRRTDVADIYLVRNTEDRWTHGHATFRVHGRSPQVWDARTGRVYPQRVYTTTQTGVQMPLTLPPHGSVIVVFVEGDAAPRFADIQPEASAPVDRMPASTADGVVAWHNGRYTVRTSRGQTRQIDIDDLPPDHTIAGPWQLRFPHGWGAPTRVEFPKLISWTDAEHEGVRHFSGVAAYHNTFDVDAAALASGRRVMLDLGNVREVAEVWINGRSVGIAWHAPYQLDITDHVRPGANQLLIEVANTLNNRLVGDAQKPAEYRRTHSNITRIPTAWAAPWEKAKLAPSGLLGPVTVRFGSVIASTPSD